MVKTGKEVVETRHPAVQHLTQMLQERIEQREYLPGTWLPTERSLALEFDVDRAMIRAALTQLAQQGLIVRAPGRRPWVNDQVTHTAPPPGPRRRTVVRTLAAILPQRTFYPASLAILQGIGQALQLWEAPYRLLVFDNYDGRDTPITSDPERRALQAAEQEDIAGVILWQMGGAQTLPELRNLSDSGVPMVFVDRYPEEFDCDFVGIDNRFGARQAVEYLFGLGHRRIAHLTNNEAVVTVREREMGYREAMRLQGLSTEGLIYTLPIGTPPEIGPVEALWDQPAPPSAVFTVNDYTAFTFMAELERAGKRVPEDVSLVGFDDIERFSPRPGLLTTLQQPFELMGQRAGELLLSRLDQEAAGASRSCQHILLPTPMLVRATCRRMEATP